MSASIPNLGEMALQLEYRLVEAVEADPMGREISAEIAQTVADARQMDLAGLLAWGRALHAAAAICFALGDEDGKLLHDMAQRLIGRAFDRVALSAPPVPESIVRHQRPSGLALQSQDMICFDPGPGVCRASFFARSRAASLPLRSSACHLRSTYTRRRELVGPGETLQYNPYTRKREYAPEGAMPRYNPYTKRRELVGPD